MRHNYVSPIANTASDKVSSDRWNADHIWVAIAEPDNPAEGTAIPWMSNGTGLGDEGDIMVKVNVGGTVKYCTLCDFSNATVIVEDTLLLETGDILLTEAGDSLLIE